MRHYQKIGRALSTGFRHANAGLSDYRAGIAEAQAKRLERRSTEITRNIGVSGIGVGFDRAYGRLSSREKERQQQRFDAWLKAKKEKRTGFQARAEELNHKARLLREAANALREQPKN